MRVLAHGHSVVRSRALVSLEFVIDIGHSLFYVVHTGVYGPHQYVHIWVDTPIQRVPRYKVLWTKVLWQRYCG